MRLRGFDFLQLPSQSLRATGVYVSGALYSLAFYLMLDAALFSKFKNDSDLHVGYVDWVPLQLATLGMIVISLVETSRLTSGGVTFGSDYGGINDAWTAKIVLFIGFAFLSGGLASSILILVLKYLMHSQPHSVLTLGVQNVISALSIVFSCFILWMAQNVQDDYSYSLQL